MYAELRESLSLLVINKGKLRWFGLDEWKDDADWVSCCMTVKVEGMAQDDLVAWR